MCAFYLPALTLTLKGANTHNLVRNMGQCFTERLANFVQFKNHNARACRGEYHTNIFFLKLNFFTFRSTPCSTPKYHSGYTYPPLRSTGIEHPPHRGEDKRTGMAVARSQGNFKVKVTMLHWVVFWGISVLFGGKTKMRAAQQPSLLYI